MSDADDQCIIELNRSLRISRQPESISVTAGQNAVFSIGVEGETAPCTYCWQKLEGGKWVDIVTVDEPTLTLKKVSEEMDGMTIRCVVSDSADGRVVSDSVTLTVIEGKQSDDDNNHGLNPLDTGNHSGLLAAFIILFSSGLFICRELLRKK